MIYHRKLNSWNHSGQFMNSAIYSKITCFLCYFSTKILAPCFFYPKNSPSPSSICCLVRTCAVAVCALHHLHHMVERYAMGAIRGDGIENRVGSTGLGIQHATRFEWLAEVLLRQTAIEGYFKTLCFRVMSGVDLRRFSWSHRMTAWWAFPNTE